MNNSYITATSELTLFNQLFGSLSFALMSYLQAPNYHPLTDSTKVCIRTLWLWMEGKILWSCQGAGVSFMQYKLHCKAVIKTKITNIIKQIKGHRSWCDKTKQKMILLAQETAANWWLSIILWAAMIWHDAAHNRLCAAESSLVLPATAPWLPAIFQTNREPNNACAVG